MPEGRGATLVAGAVVGVLVVLAALFGVVGFFDDRWVTRREYDTVLRDINRRLVRIESKVDDLGPPPRNERRRSTTNRADTEP